MASTARQRNAPKNLSGSATTFADCHVVWHVQCQTTLIVSEVIGIRQLKSESSFHIFHCSPIKSGPESRPARTFSSGPPPDWVLACVRRSVTDARVVGSTL